MRKDYIFISLLFVSLTLGGCASFRGYPDRAVSSENQLKEVEKYLQPEIVNECNDPQKTSEEKRRLRDDTVNARLLAYDIYFATFLEELRKEGVGYGIATDWTVIALSSAAGLVGSKGMKSALAATAGGLTGAKSAFDKNVYFEKTMPALIAQMVAHRKEVLRDIREGLIKSFDEYPLNQALNDLERYYNAGTLPGAIIEIAEKAGETAEDADAQIKEILTYGVDTNTELLKKYLGWDGKKVRNMGNLNQLRNWMNINSLASEEISNFLLAKEYKKARRKAVVDLNIE